MKIFISTGEVSGDLQGALLVEALIRQASSRGLDLEIVAVGGEKMAAAGARLLGNTSSIGSVGIIESLPYVLPTVRVHKKIKEYLQQESPDAIVLIDYMGPNLGIGTYIRKGWSQIPIIWYIAPQEWVWSLGGSNTAKIVALADVLLGIFPEEVRYFREKGARVTWIGHPILDRMAAAPTREEARRALGIESDRVAIALLPASRQQELTYLMPVMFEAAKIIQDKVPGARFWIPLSREDFRRPIEEAIDKYGLRATILATDFVTDVADGLVMGDGECGFSLQSAKSSSENRIVSSKSKIQHLTSLTVLAAADLAIAKSGTVNLELALLEVPQVVIYRVNPITAWIARYLLKFSIPFMSPVNLVEMKAIVPELLQEKATPENIVSEALELLLNSEVRTKTINDYRQMRRALGEVGVGDRAANTILNIALGNG
ncbi:MAG: lipid-A-disaccharide synthase [Okeania sp. SIO2H7]|nr:lipid-A-disaccharide synthase [Okeania sp. SIO2H7]